MDRLPDPRTTLSQGLLSDEGHNAMGIPEGENPPCPHPPDLFSLHFGRPEFWILHGGMGVRRKAIHRRIE